jgi:ribonuclease E
MDRGGKLREEQPSAGAEGVAADASARVGEILAEAERHGQDVHEEAERAAEGIRRSAREDAERLLAEARAETRAEARKRAEQLTAIQAALAARGPVVVEGLEGAGVTRSRLEALIAVLAAAAESVLAEAEAGDPHGAKPAPAGDPEPESTASTEEDAPEEAEPLDAEPEASVTDDEGEAAPADDDVAPADEDPAPGRDGNGSGDVGADEIGPVRYDGELPEGAPLARRPKRSRDRDARFAALLLALQGRDRGDVEEHLRSEHGVKNSAAILDEVFGRADAHA